MKHPPAAREHLRTQPGKLGWLRGLYRYYRDPTASPLGKLAVFFAAIYVVLPVDMVPDVPFIGWLDDIGVMGLAMGWLARKASSYRAPQELPPGESEDETSGPGVQLRPQVGGSR